MKKLILTLIALFSITCVFSQNYGEFFVNKFTQEYDSINKLCVTKNMIYVMNHFWSTDTLKNVDVTKRMNHLNVSYTPTGFIKGYKLGDNDLLNPTKWDEINSLNPFYVTATVKSKMERFGYMNPPLNVFTTYINLTGTYDGDKHIIAMVTENFPNTKYKHVMRQIMYDTIYAEKQINYSIQFKSNWTLDNCELTIIIENSNKKVIGAIQVPIRSTFTSGIDTDLVIKTLLYPNPVINELNITNDEPIKSIKVFDMTGKLLAYKFKDIESNTYKLEMNYPSGLYLVSVNDNNPQKIIKQ